MKYKIFAFVSAFIISINCIGSASLTVYANGHGGGGSARPSNTISLTGYDEWCLEDKFDFWLDNLLTFAGNWCGVIFNPARWTIEDLHKALEAKAYELYLAEDCANFQEYVLKHVGVNDNNEYYADDELVDLMYQTFRFEIDENSPFYTGSTFEIADLTPMFTDLNHYKNVANIVKNMNANEFAKIMYFSRATGGSLAGVVDGVNTNFPFKYCVLVCPFDGLVLTSETNTTVNVYHEWDYWNKIDLSLFKLYAYDVDGNDISVEMMDFIKSCISSSGNGYLPSTMFGSLNRLFVTSYCSEVPDVNTTSVVKSTKETVRIYKTYEDYKDYSVGNRPYYVTDKFQNYDISGDNSCIISESDLSNGSVYGDVYNYIINNYDNPDGLTEEELRRILDEYFDDLDDGNGGGGSGGGSGGGGLLDFLGGLGSIGDAILSILGKLLEYVGKAIDLLSGTVTKVIDIIPQNITNLLGGLFPFIPQEWLTAIELSLVLAVIIGIVGIFKK